MWRRERQRQRRRAVGVVRSRIFLWLLMGLAFFAILPPIFFHFKLRRFQQMQLRKCGWLNNPPLVCAHGGDSSRAFPNTMDAYRSALHSHVDCIEIDVSRSLDGGLFAVHDRELQQILGNSTSRVGYMSRNEMIGHNIDIEPMNVLDSCLSRIEELNDHNRRASKFHDIFIPSVEDALKLVSGSVRQVILDAKVGPPLFENGLANDIISAVEKTQCKNCVIWAKSDNLVRDIKKQSADVMVGYIVMTDPATGTRTNLLRMRDAGVVGVYHGLVDENIVKIVHRRKKKVYVWTVDDEVSMQKMLVEHVDAVVTGNPTLFQRVMQNMRTECAKAGYSLSS